MRASPLHLPPARHRLRAEQRLALALLASVPHGVAEDLLVLAHGFDSDVVAASSISASQRYGAKPSRRAGLRSRSFA
jgi:hypothetical protein